MTTHCQLVKNLVKPGEEILLTLTPTQAHLLHMMLGLCGEAGELIDTLKGTIIYRKPIDIHNIVEELGDIEFYLEGIRQALGITRPQTIEANIAKLTLRYGDTYSDRAAQERADKQ